MLLIGAYLSYFLDQDGSPTRIPFMAPKRVSDQPKNSNKIRFVMLEADLSDGNLAELTQAITNALKPAAAPVRFISAPNPKTIENGSVGVAPAEE